MLSYLLSRRWSTLSLISSVVGVGGLVYIIKYDDTASSVSATMHVSAPAHALSPSGYLADDPELIKAEPTPETVSIGERWARLSTSPRTMARVREMAAFLDDLAMREPARALELALAEPNFRTRETLRNAVLSGWASIAPGDAAAWALTLSEQYRPAAMESVCTGAGRRPQEALDFGRRLFAGNPALAYLYGPMLLTSLTDAGEYETAVRMATDVASPHHAAWLSAAVYQWASYQPDQARLALDKIKEPQARAEAFDAFVLGWAGSRPDDLAKYAMGLAPGEDRSKALSQALDQWVVQDTVTAAEWISRFSATPDLDVGVASVAISPNMVSSYPEIAAGLAESISDPLRRADTLQLVARHWEQNNPGAVERYIASTPQLRPEDGAALRKGLSPTPIEERVAEMKSR